MPLQLPNAPKDAPKDAQKDAPKDAQKQPVISSQWEWQIIS